VGLIFLVQEYLTTLYNCSYKSIEWWNEKWIVNREGCERFQLWPTFWYYPVILTDWEEPRKSWPDRRSSGSDMNLGYSEYDSGMLKHNLIQNVTLHLTVRPAWAGLRCKISSPTKRNTLCLHIRFQSVGILITRTCDMPTIITNKTNTVKLSLCHQGIYTYLSKAKADPHYRDAHSKYSSRFLHGSVSWLGRNVSVMWIGLKPCLRVCPTRRNTRTTTVRWTRWPMHRTNYNLPKRQKNADVTWLVTKRHCYVRGRPRSCAHCWSTNWKRWLCSTFNAAHCSYGIFSG
jgi:hypothetical protein